MRRTWNINVEPDFSWNTAHCLPPLLSVSNFQFHDPETTPLAASITAGVCPTQTVSSPAWMPYRRFAPTAYCSERS
ncbi:MAG: hypothetical protein ACK56F_07685, partial [bacterium]